MPKQLVRLISWIGLFCLEIYLLVRVYVIPEFEARNAPNGHWNMEAPLRSPLVQTLSIVYVAIFLIGNIGLIIMIWQRFKELGNKT